jgi:5-methylthioadenosine/S-adenosylhomocysteine deaminase
LQRGVSVSLGADGAACNNRLDMFTEMRSMALLQKAMLGPEALQANQALRIATIEGAKALGLESEIGSLETGKQADVILVNLDTLHSSPYSDPISAVVYSAESSDVKSVIINGELLMNDRELLTFEEDSVLKEANQERKALMERAGIAG